MRTLILGNDGPQVEFLHREVSCHLADLPHLNGVCCNHRICLLHVAATTDNAQDWFHEIVNKLAESAKTEQTTVVVANAQPEMLNPLRGGMEALLAMLILALPEVRFLFGTIRHSEPNKLTQEEFDAFRKANGLHHLFSGEPDPLFDGAGLREWIRWRIRNDDETRKHGKHLPKRQDFAVGLDEESDYAHLHAYTAYRFGFRAAALTTKAQADCVLGSASKYDPPKLVFEDLFLNLPDASGSYSWLGHPGRKYGRDENKEECQRHKEFERLEKAEFRVVVTSGHRPSGDGWKAEATAAYIGAKRSEGKYIETLDKPHAGIFSVWSKTKLKRRLHWTDGDGRIHRGTGDLFIWPPPWRKIELESRGSADSGGHSAPGILLLIAEHMIDRAELMLDDVHSVEDAVRGAVIATDALELLGGKTPTMAIAAVTLKHKFEVIAELQFAGVEYHFPVEYRISEIQTDVKSISRWFHKKQRKNAARNAEMCILNQLIRVFREYNQFDEEQLCLNRVRHLQHTLWMKTTGWGCVFYPVLRYGEFLLSSFPRFVAALLVWILALTVIFWWEPEYTKAPLESEVPAHTHAAAGATQGAQLPMQPIDPHAKATTDFSASDEGKSFPEDGGEDLSHSFGSAFAFFLGSNPPEEDERFLGIFIAFLAATAGLAHLGVFISHLYTIVARK